MEIKPINLNRQQIESLAESYAKATLFFPGETDIFSYVKDNLKGNISYTNNKTDSSGGSIEVKIDPKSFTIFLSNTTPTRRDIFTVAHELGHYVLHSRLGEIELTANRFGKSKSEQEANTFAAAFLMPAEEVKKSYLVKKHSISKMAEEFNVSYSAMEWRCRNLGLQIE